MLDASDSDGAALEHAGMTSAMATMVAAMVDVRFIS
jgi:hypothetical protein